MNFHLEYCMFNHCKNCKYDVKKLLSRDFDTSVNLMLKKWETVDEFLQVAEKEFPLEYVYYQK